MSAWQLARGERALKTKLKTDLDQILGKESWWPVEAFGKSGKSDELLGNEIIASNPYREDRLQVKDADEMARSVAPVVARNAIDASLPLAVLRSGRGIVSQYRLGRFQKRVGHSFFVERPAAKITR